MSSLALLGAVLAACNSGGVKANLETGDSTDWVVDTAEDDTQDTGDTDDTRDTAETGDTEDTEETDDTGDTEDYPPDTLDPDLPAYVLSSLTFEVFLENEGLDMFANSLLEHTMPPEEEINIILWVPYEGFEELRPFDADFGIGASVGGGRYTLDPEGDPLEMPYTWSGDAVVSSGEHTMLLGNVGGFGFEVKLYHAMLEAAFSDDGVDMEGWITGCISEADAEATMVFDFGPLEDFMDGREQDCAATGDTIDGWSMEMAFTAWNFH